MSKSQGKRRRSTDDMSIGGVLGTVARAHELVVGGRPWDDATQVSADYDRDRSEGSRKRRFKKEANSVRNEGQQE